MNDLKWQVVKLEVFGYGLLLWWMKTGMALPTTSGKDPKAWEVHNGIGPYYEMNLIAIIGITIIWIMLRFKFQKYTEA